MYMIDARPDVLVQSRASSSGRSESARCAASSAGLYQASTSLPRLLHELTERRSPPTIFFHGMPTTRAPRPKKEPHTQGARANG